jgi:hypothetical protein
MKNDSFDDIVRKKALDHEAPVPSGTWEAIAQMKKKRKRYPLFWWITGMSLLAGAVMLFYIKQYEFKSNGTANETLSKQQTVSHNSGQTVFGKNDAKQNHNPVSRIMVEVSGATVKEKETLSWPIAVEPGKENTGEKSNRIKKDNSITRSSQNEEFRKNQAELPGGQYFYFGAIPNDRTSSSPGNTDITRVDKEAFDVSFSQRNLSFSSDYFKWGKTAEIITPTKKIKGFTDTDSLMRLRLDSVHNLITQMMPSAANKLFKNNKLTFDISVTPFLPLQQSEPVFYLSRTNTGNMEKSEYKTDKIRIRPKPSVSYAISIHRKMNQRLSLGIGLQYAMIKEKVDLAGQETRTTYHEVQRLANGSGGPQLILDTVVSTSSSLLSINALNSYHLLSIPISVQYDLLQDRRWSLKVNGGLLATISGSYHNKIQGKLVPFDSQGMHSVRENSRNSFDLFAGLRFSRNYSSFRLFAEPVLRYNLNGYNFDAMINRKFIHQAGLSIGITYLVGH